MIILKNLKGQMKCPLHNTAKAYDIVLPDSTSSYKFFNNATISDSHEKPVRATMTGLSYSSMKEQLRNIFSDLSLSTWSNKFKSFQESNMQVKMNQQTN